MSTRTRPFLGLLESAFAAEGRKVPDEVLAGEAVTPLDGPTLPGAAAPRDEVRSEERTVNLRPRRPPPLPEVALKEALMQARDADTRGARWSRQAGA